jgi:hypothetical protein
MTGMQFRSVPLDRAVVDHDQHAALVRIPHTDANGVPVIDAHGTSWSRSTFDAAWRRQPRFPFLWSHRPDRVLGSVTRAQSTPRDFELTAGFAPLDAVSDSRAVWTLLDRGDVGSFSFGFDSAKTVPKNGHPHHTSARMRELSACSFASIPNTELVSLRSAFGTGWGDDYFDPDVAQALAMLDRIELRGEIRRIRSGEPRDYQDHLDTIAADACTAVAKLDYLGVRAGLARR